MSNLLFLISAMGNCPSPIMVDWASTPWTERDSAAYKIAIDGCKRQFDNDSPCLKKFIKKEDGAYYAICGRPNDKVSNSSRTSIRWFFIGSNQVSSREGGKASSSSSTGKECSGACTNRQPTTGGRK